MGNENDGVEVEVVGHYEEHGKGMLECLRNTKMEVVEVAQQGKRGGGKCYADVLGFVNVQVMNGLGIADFLTYVFDV